MTTLIRGALSVLALFPVFHLGGAAHASETMRDASPVLALSQLPSVSVSAPPTKKVWSVGAGESVKGLYVGKNEAMVFVAGSRIDVRRQLGQLTSAESNGNAGLDYCVSEARETSEDGMTSRLTWDGAQSVVPLFADDQRTVVPIRIEQLTEETNSGATLEILDAWVDVRSHGARLIDRQTLAMKLVTTAAGHIHVYAARDREPDLAHVVVAAPSQPQGAWQGIAQAGLAAIEHSGCRLSHAILRAPHGGADATTFFTDAVLDDVESLPAEGEGGAVQVRNRPLHIHASASWATSETEPVLSVSTGWESRARSGSGSRLRRKKR